MKSKSIFQRLEMGRKRLTAYKNKDIPPDGDKKGQNEGLKNGVKFDHQKTGRGKIPVPSAPLPMFSGAWKRPWRFALLL